MRVDAIGLLLLYLAVAFVGGIATMIGQSPGGFPSAAQIGLLAFAVADVVAIGLVATSGPDRLPPFAIAMVAVPGVALAAAIVIYV